MRHTNSPSLALSHLIAANATSYDQAPYISRPFALTRPAHLAGLARLFGCKTKPPSSARVLELGCAGGGNLIPLAARHPEAFFLGVDLSAVQIADAQKRISDLGLKNIRVEVRDLSDVGPKDGRFDYVICHGVYSWVPQPVREAILRICQTNLSEKGVALISYNVLPGWRLPQVLRDSLLEATRHCATPQESIAKARSMGALLADHVGGSPSYQQVAKEWGQKLATVEDEYLLHEFLEQSNEPCTFSDFMMLAQAHGLSFLCESELNSMVLENFPQQIADPIRALTGNRLIPTEQLIDVLTGRTFRQSILVRSEIEPHIQRQLSPESAKGLQLLPHKALTAYRTGQGGEVRGSAQQVLSTQDDTVIDMAEKLIMRLPGSSGLDDLLDSNEEPKTQQLAQDLLFRLIISGLGTPSLDPVQVKTVLADCPKVDDLVRKDAARGTVHTANLRHEPLYLSPLAQVVLALLDGKHSQAEVIQAAVAALRAGKLQVNANGQAVLEETERVALVEQETKAYLASLPQLAILV
jgi:methyltransferase-like protein/SAM-dependent methyltransferase